MHRDETEQVTQALDRLSTLLERIERPPSNSSQITVHAGGVGVWICVLCMVTMVAVSTVVAFFVSADLTRKDREIAEARAEIGDLRDYLSAIYAQAPHLRPEKED
jgi:hypothetical protein